MHLSAAALQPGRDGTDSEGIELARVDNTRSFVTADQVRVWCAAPDARVTVRPVVDLAERIRVDAYQAPDRLTEQIRAAPAPSPGARAPRAAATSTMWSPTTPAVRLRATTWLR